MAQMNDDTGGNKISKTFGGCVGLAQQFKNFRSSKHKGLLCYMIYFMSQGLCGKPEFLKKHTSPSWYGSVG